MAFVANSCTNQYDHLQAQTDVYLLWHFISHSISSLNAIIIILKQ